ncbi:MAG: serine hydrolase [Desulfobacterales bacterium]|nr:MAG: serine hydrolase [Desulfobacterales bacterium]
MIKSRSDVIMEQVDRLMRQAVSDDVFPGGVLLIAKDGTVIFHAAYGYANIFSKRPMTEDTIFDLASLTKPLATTLAVMKLVAQKKLGLGQHLGQILNRFNCSEKARIRIEHLLYHNSGLPDYRPYYKRLIRLPEDQRKNALRALLMQEPLIHPIGQETLYSDLGFMLLCWVVETASGMRLDRFVEKEIYDPLGLETLFFVDLNLEPQQLNFAATERCPWRNLLLTGLVHDENAYVVGGIEGHAGLFGTAGDIHQLLKALQSALTTEAANNLFEKEILQRFIKQNNNTQRALGFDTPAASGASCGRYFSKKSVGHLGFTGTSFWMDFEQRIIVILLTNRIHPSRDNDRIKHFRPILHDTIMENIRNHDTVKG